MTSMFHFAEIGSQPQGCSGIISFIHLDLAGGGRDKPPPYVLGRKDDELSPPDTPRVLIVEDVLMAAWHLESLAHDLKFEVCGLAADGEEAIERADDFRPTLLLMDINLGKGMDGIEAARRISENIGAAVVFVTAYNDAANLSRIKQSFPDAPVLTKPVTREALGAAVAFVRKTKHA